MQRAMCICACFTSDWLVIRTRQIFNVRISDAECQGTFHLYDPNLNRDGKKADPRLRDPLAIGISSRNLCPIFFIIPASFVLCSHFRRILSCLKRTHPLILLVCSCLEPPLGTALRNSIFRFFTTLTTTHDDDDTRDRLIT